MSEINQTKNELRKEILERLKLLPADYKTQADRAIRERLFSLPDFRKAERIFCYVSIGDEVDTREIIRDCWQAGKCVAVPKCYGKGVMKLFEIHDFSELAPGMFSIPEPKENCREVAPSEIDFAVVPCVSCDAGKNRLGYGGGYYDRFLSRTEAPFAVLVRERQMCRKINSDIWDIKAEYILTEKREF